MSVDNLMGELGGYHVATTDLHGFGAAPAVAARDCALQSPPDEPIVYDPLPKLGDIMHFWQSHAKDLPTWCAFIRVAVAVSPSLAAAERVFSAL